MALPHYKLHREALPDAPATFPVLLAPTEQPIRFASIKRIFKSRPFLVALQFITIAAGAALLWIWLDPTIKAIRPIHILVPAAILGLCCLLFTVAGILKSKGEETAPERVEEIPVINEVPIKPLAVAPPTIVSAKTEVDCEQWVSGPFQEIIDEEVIAEVFNDELIAPDRMVFSVTVTD